MPAGDDPCCCAVRARAADGGVFGLFTSHRALARAAAAAADDAPLAHAGASLREMTRVAGANPAIWADIFLENADEIADALACQISYGADDLTLVDWVSALVFDKTADDTRAVLEYGQVQLLEEEEIVLGEWRFVREIAGA